MYTREDDIVIFEDWYGRWPNKIRPN